MLFLLHGEAEGVFKDFLLSQEHLELGHVHVHRRPTPPDPKIRGQKNHEDLLREQRPGPREIASDPQGRHLQAYHDL